MEQTVKFVTYDEYREMENISNDIDVGCNQCFYRDKPCSTLDCNGGVFVGEEVPETYTKVLTGGSSDYYKVKVDNPTTPDTKPYTAECNDVIEALGLNFAEGNILKALWRRANARKGNGKLGFEDGKYDAEKMVFFANRILSEYNIK